MHVRTATVADLPVMLALMAALNPGDRPLSEPLALPVWQALLGRDGVTVWFAEVDGVVAATCTLIVVPNLTRDGRPYALIENVATLPAYRRRGCGRAVLDAALAHAWAQQCYKVMLSTSAPDPGVRDFYQRCGFDDSIKTAFVVTRY
ncbi:GNAT family N-acetyltransferase [Chitinibacteraceae bacterium HSL-7]